MGKIQLTYYAHDGAFIGYKTVVSERGPSCGSCANFALLEAKIFIKFAMRDFTAGKRLRQGNDCGNHEMSIFQYLWIGGDVYHVQPD